MAFQNLVGATSSSNIKRGSITLLSGVSYIDVVFDTPLPTPNYSVSLTIIGVGLNSVLFVTNKNENGFRINSISLPTTNVDIDWIVVW